MTYAHWEGYSKASLDRYVQLVARRKPLVTAINDGLALSHARQLLRRMDSGDPDAAAELMRLIRNEDVPRLRISSSQAVATQSNLRFTVLATILESVGLPHVAFETKRRLIDVLLCDRRNAVAHGRELFPSADEVLDLHREVIEMMGTIESLLISAVRGKEYLRPSNAGDSNPLS